MPGTVCKATNVTRSTVDPAWFVAAVALYDAGGQPVTELDRVIVNVRTRTVVGPTATVAGFCGDDPAAPRPEAGYAAVPTNVLTSLRLHPCPAARATGTAKPPPTTPHTSPPTSSEKPPMVPAALVGSWDGHHRQLTIDASGVGRLKYADVKRCPSCSIASAPLGTMTFKLARVTPKGGTGSVTGSSDAENFVVGQPVVVTLAPASPGEFLQLRFASTGMIWMCNAAAAGQCGA